MWLERQGGVPNTDSRFKSSETANKIWHICAKKAVLGAKMVLGNSYLEVLNLEEDSGCKWQIVERINGG